MVVWAPSPSRRTRTSWRAILDAERHRKRREPAVGALADVEQPEMEPGVGFVLDLVVLDRRSRGRRPPGSRRWCTWRSPAGPA